MAAVASTALVLILLLCHRPAPAAERELVLGYVEFPPYTHTAADGRATGGFIERASATLALADRDWRAEAIPAARLYEGLARGEVDLFLGIDTSPVIQGRVVASRRPVGTIRLLAFSRAGGPAPVDVEDLRGLDVGLQLGYSYGAIGEAVRSAASGIRHHEVRNALSGFRMLAAGRIDVMLHYAGPGNAAIAELGLEGIERHTLFELPCYFVLSKAVPDAVATMARIEAAYETLYPE